METIDNNKTIIPLLKKGMKRLLIINTAGLLAGIIVGPGFILLGVLLGKGENRQYANYGMAFIAVGIICLVIFIVAIVQYILQLRSNRQLLADANAAFKRLVWTYLEERKGQTDGVPIKGTIMSPTCYHCLFYFDNGVKCRTWLKRDDAFLLVRQLAEACPAVSIGWDSELLKKWKKDHNSPRNNPQKLAKVKHYLFRNRI